MAGNTEFVAGAQNAAASAVGELVQMREATLLEFQRYFFIYQMGTLLEILILAFLIFVFKPFFPFVISRIWTHLPVVGIMTRVRLVVPFGGFTLRNGMYRKEFRDNVMYYVKKYLGSYSMFGVPFDIVHIDRGFVQDLIYNKYIAALEVMGYKNISAIENALTFNGIDPNVPESEVIVTSMGFETYEVARQAMNPANITMATDIYAPRFTSIPIDALLDYGADIAPGSIAAQVSDTFEFRKPPEDKNLILELIPYAILLIAIAISGAILITYIPT